MDRWRRRSDAPPSIASWIRTAPRRIKSRASSTAISRSRIPLRARLYRFYDDDDDDDDGGQRCARKCRFFLSPAGTFLFSLFSLSLSLSFVVWQRGQEGGETEKEKRERETKRDSDSLLLLILSKESSSSSSRSFLPYLDLTKDYFVSHENKETPFRTKE